jgi:hypothetical protein
MEGYSSLRYPAPLKVTAEMGVEGTCTSVGGSCC